MILILALPVRGSALFHGEVIRLQNYFIFYKDKEIMHLLKEHRILKILWFISPIWLIWRVRLRVSNFQTFINELVTWDPLNNEKMAAMVWQGFCAIRSSLLDNKSCLMELRARHGALIISRLEDRPGNVLWRGERRPEDEVNGHSSKFFHQDVLHGLITLQVPAFVRILCLFVRMASR